jgi:phosphoribosylanthranilate isomerase
MIKVKVCGMYDPFNVKELAEAKPDFIGFIFYPGSPRFIGEEPGMALFSNVPQGIKRVGVFFNEGNSKILDLSVINGLDIVQLHGNESPVSCSRLKSSGLTLIKTFNIDNDFSFELLKEYIPACDFFLFDTKSKIPGGSGRKFNWRKLDEYSLEKPFFLSGGIGPEDTHVIKTIRNRGFFAVDINSCFEISPGIKDVGLVKTFINEIKNDQL